MRNRDSNRFPTLAFFIDRHGKRHAPPPPPLVEGRPPWVPLPNEYRRDAVLAKCPALACRRAQACRSPHYRKFCRKTHLRAEEFRARLAAKIDRLMKAQVKALGLGAVAPPAEKDGSLRGLKRAFEQRLMDDEHKFLLDWQENWVREMQAKEAAEISAQVAEAAQAARARRASRRRGRRNKGINSARK
jgi:hypothetical protein